MTSRRPPVPSEQRTTYREQLSTQLKLRPMTARELSGAVGLAEKLVLDHLQHIQRACSHSGERFCILPARCKKCGFTFSKRSRLSRPGKCPCCRATSLSEPRFAID